MTKNEFFLRSVIAMAGNYKYIIDGELHAGYIIRDAEALAERLELHNIGIFDDDADETADSMKTLVCNISDSLFDIKEAINDIMCAITTKTDDGLNPFQVQAQELHEIDKTLCDMASSLELMKDAE